MTASYSKTAFVGTSDSCCQQVTPSSLNDPNNGKDALIPLPLEIKTPKMGLRRSVCVCARMAVGAHPLAHWKCGE